jgi:hypothetical protein
MVSICSRILETCHLHCPKGTSFDHDFGVEMEQWERKDLTGVYSRYHMKH